MNDRALSAALLMSAALLAPGAVAGDAPQASSGGAIEDKFRAFLRLPSPELYAAVRKELVASGTYAPYSTELHDVTELYRKGEYQAARKRLEGARLNLILSPRMHYAMAAIADKVGDTALAQDERAAARACLEGLLSTGDGTEARPYVVTRIEDEYDVVEALHLHSGGQGLRNAKGHAYDVLDVGGGKELWFDISEPFGALGKELGK